MMPERVKRAEVHAVTNALIAHERGPGLSGACSCGHEAPLGTVFHVHQAEVVLAVLKYEELWAEVIHLRQEKEKWDYLVESALNPHCCDECRDNVRNDLMERTLAMERVGDLIDQAEAARAGNPGVVLGLSIPALKQALAVPQDVIDRYEREKADLRDKTAALEREVEDLRSTPWKD